MLRLMLTFALVLAGFADLWAGDADRESRVSAALGVSEKPRVIPDAPRECDRTRRAKVALLLCGDCGCKGGCKCDPCRCAEPVSKDVRTAMAAPALMPVAAERPALPKMPGRWSYPEVREYVAKGHAAFMFVAMRPDRTFGEKEVWCEVAAKDAPGFDPGLYLCHMRDGKAVAEPVAARPPIDPAPRVTYLPPVQPACKS